MHVMGQAEDMSARGPRAEGGGVELVQQALGLEAFGDVDEAHVVERTGEGSGRDVALDLHQVRHGRAGEESGEHAVLQRVVIEQHELVGLVGMLAVPFGQHRHVAGRVRAGERPENAARELVAMPCGYEHRGNHGQHQQHPHGWRGELKKGANAFAKFGHGKRGGGLLGGPPSRIIAITGWVEGRGSEKRTPGKSQSSRNPGILTGPRQTQGPSRARGRRRPGSRTSPSYPSTWSRRVSRPRSCRP